MFCMETKNVTKSLYGLFSLRIVYVHYLLNSSRFILPSVGILSLQQGMVWTTTPIIQLVVIVQCSYQYTGIVVTGMVIEVYRGINSSICLYGYGTLLRLIDCTSAPIEPLRKSGNVAYEFVNFRPVVLILPLFSRILLSFLANHWVRVSSLS